MWKPSTWRGLILTFEFFQCISSISFNNSPTRHPLCCMTSRTNLQKPCSFNSSTHQWRQKKKEQKNTYRSKDSHCNEKEQKRRHLVCPPFKINRKRPDNWNGKWLLQRPLACVMPSLKMNLKNGYAQKTHQGKREKATDSQLRQKQSLW